MQEKEKIEEKDRENILGILSKKSADSEKTELVFECEDSETSGLVFLDENDSAADEPADDAPSMTNLKFEASDEPEYTPPVFSVPEKFEVNEKYNVETEPTDDTLKLRATYVPRFTEVSENYRMANDPRPRFTKNIPEIVTAENKLTEKQTLDIDPTAEIEEERGVSDKISVKNVKPLSDDDPMESSTKVFKFKENELPEEEASAPEETASVSEPEIAFDEEPETEAPDEASSDTEADEIDINLAIDKEYAFPDPSAEPKAIIDYTAAGAVQKSMTLEDAPQDVGDREQYSETKRSSGEYTSYTQRDTHKDGFLDKLMSIRVRFFASVIIALILLIMESVYAFGVDIPKLLSLNTVPGAMAILDIQLIACLYLLTIPEVISSFKYLIRGKAISELTVTAAFIVTVIYSVLISIDPPRSYPLFGLIFAVLSISVISGAYYRKSADFTAFKVISDNEEKYVVDRKYTRELERENAALDGRIEEHRSKIARFFRTVFVDNFFTKAGVSSENSFNVTLIISSSFGAALVMGIIAYFIPGGIANAAIAFALTFLLSVPAVSILAHKLPYYYIERAAESEDTAVIGESSVLDYSGIDVIAFQDTEVFGDEDVNLQRIMLYGNSDNLTKALRQMSALFMNVGGPLDILFSDSLDRKVSPALNTYVERDGVGGEIDGHRVLAGPKEYMMRNGIRIPEDTGKNVYGASESTKIMYAAEDGAVYAKFYIRYSFSEEFSMLLPALWDEGITPLVYTRDPNVTDELVRTLTAGSDKIRVYKNNASPAADLAVYRRVSAGMVSKAEKTNAINTILLTKKYAAFQSRLAVTELIAMTVGAALGAVFTFAGMSLVPSVALAAWQAAWCGVLHFLSAKSFPKSDKK